MSTGSWRRLLIAASPVGVASVLSLLMFRVDTAILAFLESDAVVGAYGAAFRLFEATLFLSWAVTTAVYPVLARLSTTSRPSVGEVFDGSLKLVVALTLPLGVGMAILSEPIVHLVFGQQFDELSSRSNCSHRRSSRTRSRSSPAGCWSRRTASGPRRSSTAR